MARPLGYFLSRNTELVSASSRLPIRRRGSRWVHAARRNSRVFRAICSLIRVADSERGSNNILKGARGSGFRGRDDLAVLQSTVIDTGDGRVSTPASPPPSGWSAYKSASDRRRGLQQSEGIAHRSHTHHRERTIRMPNR